MHLGPAHLLERHLLSGHHLGEARRSEVGGGVAGDHDREVAERRHVRRSGGRRPEQRADLGNATREGDLVEEDVAPRVASGVAVELLVDASAGGVDEVHERRADLVGELLHARDLLERAPAPRAGLHRVVVGDEARRATVDGADGGDHGVAGQAVLGAREQSVLEVGFAVEEQTDAVANEQLALGEDPFARLVGTAASGHVETPTQFVTRRCVGHVADVGHVVH